MASVGEPFDVAGRDPAEQGRQPGQPGQLLTASRAVAQVCVDYRAFGRIDRAHHIDA